MTARHWIRDDPNPNDGAARKIITHCGREGYFAGTDEFVTVQGMRFEAHGKLRSVDCKQCLKSAERISNTSWGGRRIGAMR